MAAVTAPFMAVSLQQAPSSGASVMSAKSDLQAAGRRKLDKFRAKAGKSKQAAKPIEPVKRADSNGDVHIAAEDPIATEVFVTPQESLVQPLVPEKQPDPVPVALEQDPVEAASSNVHSSVNLLALKQEVPGPVETKGSGPSLDSSVQRGFGSGYSLDSTVPLKRGTVETRLDGIYVNSSAPVKVETKPPVETMSSGALLDSSMPLRQDPVETRLDSSVPLKQDPVETRLESSVPLKQDPVETRLDSSVPMRQAPVETRPAGSGVALKQGSGGTKVAASSFVSNLHKPGTRPAGSSSVHSSANFSTGIHTDKVVTYARLPGYEERGKENLSLNIMDRLKDSSLANNSSSALHFTTGERPEITSTNAGSGVDGSLRSVTSLPTVPRRDEFAASEDALEQHIEDLTQEKFQLQRGLEKARKLVETLTQDNAALTQDYNQQSAKVNELKDEIAKYQERIRSQENFIKSLKAETDKAHQESTAATERARSFAAESVALEEKLLKTRSQELKLQKEVESLRAELESTRKQISSIEKDRSNALSMNEALQEEKKLLLSRIREAASEKSSALFVPPAREDASTSTDDLVVEEEASNATVQTEEEIARYPTSIPSDHLGIIDSINALVTELGQEKDELLRALRNETSSVAQLKAENAELSQRLERQTQQLELAFAQNMARVGGASSSLSPASVYPGEELAEYVDEGDEVVDRVLGWIMRLFPGSSKRGGSKHL